MLLLNRQISEEASHVLYSAPTFHFDDPESLAVFLLATPERHLAVITKLIITIILHPEQSAPAAWMQYIASGVIGKMKGLKVFEVCIWATYPEPYLRESRQFEKLGNSKYMPCLERGIVAVVEDRPRRRKAFRNALGAARLAHMIADLIIGEPGESHRATRWRIVQRSCPTTASLYLTNNKLRTLNNG